MKQIFKIVDTPSFIRKPVLEAFKEIPKNGEIDFINNSYQLHLLCRDITEGDLIEIRFGGNLPENNFTMGIIEWTIKKYWDAVYLMCVKTYKKIVQEVQGLGNDEILLVVTNNDEMKLMNQVVRVYTPGTIL